ncbi:retron Ec48 family effector membrane protein [Paraburkholderia strydomiana]|uniref:retron Ec48 family effector membrane protein n=1 Tax=Paraburkholderia strydomiana TaxID=1245417 RepID=UPI0038BA0596
MSNSGKSWLKWLLISLGLIAISGYGASAISLICTTFADQILSLDFCFTNACVKNWLSYFPDTLSIAKATSDFLVAIATTGGIVVALMSYISSINNSALTNHIAHYTVFQGFIDNEIKKRNRIHAASVDTFFWYNLIYPNSRNGVVGVSKQYTGVVLSLNKAIEESNARAQHAANGSFRYKPHQIQMITLLQEFGIQLQQQPRNDFYEIEDQIISLIVVVNNSFCYSEFIAPLAKRKYI